MAKLYHGNFVHKPHDTQQVGWVWRQSLNQIKRYMAASPSVGGKAGPTAQSALTPGTSDGVNETESASESQVTRLWRRFPYQKPVPPQLSTSTRQRKPSAFLGNDLKEIFTTFSKSDYSRCHSWVAQCYCAPTPAIRETLLCTYRKLKRRI